MCSNDKIPIISDKELLKITVFTVHLAILVYLFFQLNRLLKNLMMSAKSSSFGGITFLQPLQQFFFFYNLAEF